MPFHRALIVLLALLTLPGLALADEVVLKNGNVIEGQVQVDEARQRVVVQRNGATLTFEMTEVARIIRAPKGKGGEAKPPPRKPANGPAEVVVIPLYGPIDSYRSRGEFNDALENALSRKPKLIVFEISSTGGLIQVARHFVKSIIALERRGVRTAAFVNGTHGGAYSAAAYVALACDRIYMAPGQALGAAVAWSASPKGTPSAVSAKFNSAWQAEFRATAEANGHPGVLAGAMVSAEHGAAEIQVGGKKAYVRATEVLGVEDAPAHRVICAPGKVLTLTSQEARRLGISRGTAKDTSEFLTRLRFEPTQSARLSCPLALARARVKKEQLKLNKDIAKFNKDWQKLVAEAPGNHRYELGDNGLFKDGGRAWRRRTKASLKYLKRCLKKLESMRERIEDEIDLKIDRKVVAEYGEKLRKFDKVLRSLRGAKRPPR